MLAQGSKDHGDQQVKEDRLDQPVKQEHEVLLGLRVKEDRLDQLERVVGHVLALLRVMNLEFYYSMPLVDKFEFIRVLNLNKGDKMNGEEQMGTSVGEDTEPGEPVPGPEETPVDPEPAEEPATPEEPAEPAEPEAE